MNCNYQKTIGNKSKYSLKRNKSLIHYDILSKELLYSNDVPKVNSDNAKNIKKQFSRSISISDYVPLTKRQKILMIKEMDNQSNDQFNKYSSIFNEIKQHITDINESLSTSSFIELKTPTNNNRNHININFPLIPEVQEEYNNSSQKPIPKNEYNQQVKDFDEEKKVIVINQSSLSKSLTNNKLKIKQTRKLLIRRENTCQESFPYIKKDKKEDFLEDQDYETQETAATQPDNINIQFSEDDRNICQCIIY